MSIREFTAIFCLGVGFIMLGAETDSSLPFWANLYGFIPIFIGYLILPKELLKEEFMPNHTVLIHYDKKIVETEQAVLIAIDTENQWIPFSVIEEDFDDGSMEVKQWFAEKEGLI